MDIVSKIEAFVKKYYLNRLIQGLIFGAVLLIAIFLFVNGVEFLSWLPRKGRFILFLLFVLSSLFVLILYFFVPLVNLVRYRKKMTDKQAAVLIGKFFPTSEINCLTHCNFLMILKIMQIMNCLSLP